jgi:hypothetical protein
MGQHRCFQVPGEACGISLQGERNDAESVCHPFLPGHDTRGVVLSDEERYNLASLEDLNITLPGDRTIPLLNGVALDSRRAVCTAIPP